MNQFLAKLYRRWRARHWRCRCGKRVFDRHALQPHPLAPSHPGCGWHESVRRQVLSGDIRHRKDAS